VPTLIVWGSADAIIPVEHGIAAHDLIDHSRLEVIDGVGHLPHVEAPAEFIEVLGTFIDTTPCGPWSEESLRDAILRHGGSGGPPPSRRLRSVAG
jgi:hypothetical protein